MIAVDTNILVRLVTNDSPKQVQKAVKVISNQNIFVAKTVILEMEWVLRSAYKLEANYICKAIHAILGLANVETEDASDIFQALEWYKQGLDFADALHLASCKQVDQFITFDEKFSRQAKLMTTITVNCI